MFVVLTAAEKLLVGGKPFREEDLDFSISQTERRRVKIHQCVDTGRQE